MIELHVVVGIAIEASRRCVCGFGGREAAAIVVGADMHAPGAGEGRAVFADVGGFRVGSDLTSQVQGVSRLERPKVERKVVVIPPSPICTARVPGRSK